MPALNKGTSTYHSIHGLYWRESDGQLLAVEGGNSQALPECWPELCKEICSPQSSWNSLKLPSGKIIKTLQINTNIAPLEHNIRANFPPSYRDEELVTHVSEIEHPDGRVVGILTSRPGSLAGDEFGAWAERFILLNTQFQPLAQLSSSTAPQHRVIVEKVADIFEEKLKNVSRDDQWHHGGRESFMNKVYGYVERNIPILLCLPAFPCKSPNPNKVGGSMPDLAEHIALDVLRSFIRDVCQVYRPGATLWIISDGHVFSDCIGVDDTKVDTYDARLIEVYKEKFPVEDGPVPAMRFKGLKDIFMSNEDSFSSFQESWLAAYNVPHPVKTEITEASELCRRLLLGVSEADRKFVRSCIEEQEPHALQLYRGQTRFMLEDLAEVPSVRSLSNKQRKKTAAFVAQEMISRNQAYSNLVELLLPNYVRLSIHAHNNRGPKFAVRLLPKSLVRPIDSLEHRFEPVPAYEFQIPTPWHNSIIKVEGDGLLYLARSEVATKAIDGDNFEGTWVTSPSGSYFSLRRTTPPTPIEVVASPTAPIRVVTPLTTVEEVAVFDEKKYPMVIVSPTRTISRVDTHFSKGKWRLVIPLHPMFAIPSFMRQIWRYINLGA